MNKKNVGELKRALAAYPDDWEIFFGGGDLRFFRLKPRGEKTVQMEFDQNVWRDSEGEWHVDGGD